MSAIEYSINVRPSGSHNLIASNENYKQFALTVINPARRCLKQLEIVSPRELRAAFLIELYELKSGQLAPVKGHTINKERDRIGRESVSHAAGHNSDHTSNSYIGGRR